MKLKKTRTCDGCKAIGGNGKCTLRFNNSGSYDRVLGMRRIVPQEPCYKPLTIQELFESEDLRK